MRHMANVITRCVTWKDCIYVSQMSFTSSNGIFFLCPEWRCVPTSSSSNSQSARPFMFYLSVSGFIHLPCHHCRLAGINHSKHHTFCESGRSFTHAFMQFYFAQLQLQKTQYLQLGQNRGQYYGGSLPNVNQIGNGNIDLPFQVSP